MIDTISTDLRARLVAVALAPYRHFRDKGALLAAVALQGFETLRRELLAADQKPNAPEALIAQGEAYVAFARRHPKLFRLMFAGHDGGPPPVEDNAYGVMVRRVRQIAPDNLEAATLAFWSAVTASPHWRLMVVCRLPDHLTNVRPLC
ncbi:WHG domain-containing protein [Gluconobacter kondonii]|uniref:TetR/AcrR family transcriptional regulator n=1 Tax=Gluconobacter TaxID=441 RepID=UPI001B8C7090|nr:MULTISPECIES: TetR-like C-terminal domain-containing protein [Gluconobacter]MBS1089747.1 WHG domain-containing protein [Gluconobacter wancherniae]MCP1237614.1 WHG domain-containing protein [Gluconobacter kondonii]